MTKEMIKTRNSLMITLLVLGAISFIVGLFFLENFISWFLGIVIGILISLFRLFSMSKSLEKTVDMEVENAKNYYKAQYMLRYIVSFAIAVVACYLGFANPIGLIVGLVLLQPTVYIYQLIEKKKN